MDVFTEVGLSRIAVACGATASDIATGNPAMAFVERWLDKPADEWFSDVPVRFDTRRGRVTPARYSYARAYRMIVSWPAFEAAGPLPLIRFAGFIEVGVRAGYIKLAHFLARDELQTVLERWDLGQDFKDPAAGLAASLRNRLKSQLQGFEVARRAVGVSVFEDYMDLDEMVHHDSDVREFLIASHRASETKDGFFLSSPDAFVQALTAFRVQRLFVGGQAVGGLKVVRLFERFSALLTSIRDVDLREAIILHARWAHQADWVFQRLARWRGKARDWSLERNTSDDSDHIWDEYVRSTVVTLTDFERALGLLASSSWRSDALFDEEDVIVRGGVGSTDNTIATLEDLESRGDEAESHGRISAALTIFSEAAQLRVERLEEEVSEAEASDVLLLWTVIEKIQRLGDKETAVAISSAVYPYFAWHLTDEHKEAFEALMRPLTHQRSTTAEVRESSDELRQAIELGSSIAEFDYSQALGESGPADETTEPPSGTREAEA